MERLESYKMNDSVPVKSFAVSVGFSYDSEGGGGGALMNSTTALFIFCNLRSATMCCSNPMYARIQKMGSATPVRTQTRYLYEVDMSFALELGTSRKVLLVKDAKR